MFKFVCSAVLCCGGLICSEASACGPGCNCTCSQPVATAMPSMPGMPGMPAQANAGTQYRTYSYQPAATPTYRSNSRSNGAAGFRDATFKARGGF